MFGNCEVICAGQWPGMPALGLVLGPVQVCFYCREALRDMNDTHLALVCMDQALFCVARHNQAGRERVAREVLQAVGICMCVIGS